MIQTIGGIVGPVIGAAMGAVLAVSSYWAVGTLIFRESRFPT